MKRLLNYVPKDLKITLLENRYLLGEISKRHTKRLKKYLQLSEGLSLKIDDKKKWIRKLIRLSFAYPNLIEVADEFCKSEMVILKEKVMDESVIAICVAKNDLTKMKGFINHHRKLGIHNFVILDNDSTDGSIEWLLEQNDVFLLQTKIPYTTNRREAWVNRIMAYFGDERWYYVADSDELLVYEDCENRGINELIRFFEAKGIVRARALMVDMYAKAKYYKDGKIEEYLNECIYFDSDTYYESERHQLDLICGGPRERIFNQAPWLTKYPIFYLRKKDLECKSHFLFPFAENKDTQCNIILKHYKFQPGELNKYQQIVKAGNYFNGSKQYKAYLNVLEGTDDLDFFCKSTREYKDSFSLHEIKNYSPIEWESGIKR